MACVLWFWKPTPVCCFNILWRKNCVCLFGTFAMKACFSEPGVKSCPDMHHHWQPPVNLEHQPERGKRSLREQSLPPQQLPSFFLPLNRKGPESDMLVRPSGTLELLKTKFLRLQIDRFIFISKNFPLWNASTWERCSDRTRFKVT
jgi:hypothetical protein